MQVMLTSTPTAAVCMRSAVDKEVSIAVALGKVVQGAQPVRQGVVLAVGVAQVQEGLFKRGRVQPLDEGFRLRLCKQPPASHHADIHCLARARVRVSKRERECVCVCVVNQKSKKWKPE